MIVDNIQRLPKYSPSGSDLTALAAFLKSHDLSKLPLGKYVISDNCFFTLKEYRARPAEQIKWETHRNFLDIQYLISGSELMGWCPVEEMEGAQTYSALDDVTYYASAACPCRLPLRRGMFVLLEPSDAHFPSWDDGSHSFNRKAVIKVRVKL